MSSSCAPPSPHDTSAVRVEIYRGVDRLKAPLTQFAIECTQSLLAYRPFLALLAENTDIIPKNASPAQVDGYISKVQKLLQKNNPVAFQSCAFPKASTWARTSRTSSGTFMYLSSALVSALEDTSAAALNAPLLVTLAVTTIAHEVTHWVRFLLNIPITPPTRHVSRFCSRGSNDADDDIHGESGYALEAALWGGVVTALFKYKHDIDGGHISAVQALCLEARPLWSVDQFKNNNGPPTKEYLPPTLHLLRRLHRIKDGEFLSFPLFDISTLTVIGHGHEYNGYYRTRGECEEKDDVSMERLYGQRRPSACGKDDDPDSFPAFV
ncbi:hypothetical protein B0H12DRAFT_1091539 [Mycena haematopus]|nr:hypothetical protein B0H12DRAFT_1091539 [Mycena haematopus]